MNRFREELKIIPTAARVIGWVLYAAIVLAFAAAFLSGADADMNAMPLPLKIFVTLAPGFLVFLPIYLIGYIYADAKRRGMRYVMWTLLAIFVPNAIGIILYFILRDPLPQPCVHCSFMVRSGFAFCPACGTQVSRACAQCRRPVEAGWANCAYCGAKLG